MAGAYYNEIEPYAAQWLRNLISAGHIPSGDVDTRGIAEVSADDLRGYTQCHFFAGIGGWPHALRLALWPDDRPVWTGSCPCQPFSSAGRQKGKEDDRHLWPVWFSLIRERRPPVVFGEQVASSIGHGWLDGVCADMEGIGYAVGASVLPACAVGAPHRRDRLWFVADSARQHGRAGLYDKTARRGRAVFANGDGLGDMENTESIGCRERRPEPEGQQGRSGVTGPGVLGNATAQRRGEAGQCCAGPEERPSRSGAMADAGGGRCREQEEREGQQSRRTEAVGASFMGDALGAGLEGQPGHGVERRKRQQNERRPASSAGLSFWSDYDTVTGHDGKERRTPPAQSGIRPLAHGVSARVGRLRAYGNAIVPQVAAEFVRAFTECKP